MPRWRHIARRLVVIDAPTNLGLAPTGPGPEPGTRDAPYALRALGLHAALKSEREIRVEAPAYLAERRATDGLRNVAAVVEHAVRLANVLEPIIRSGDFPLVLGGDCSLLIGSMLANARIGGPALLFIDGHTDFYLPAQSTTGGLAGIDLALVAGWGPSELTDIEGRRPLVRPDQIAALANRDFDPLPKAEIPSLGDVVAAYLPLHELRAVGMAKSIETAAGRIAGNGRRFWIHFDVDAIDSQLMGAVDSPQPNGLNWAETHELLAAALAADPVGLQITIYDPARDPDRVAGRALADLLVDLLA